MRRAKLANSLARFIDAATLCSSRRQNVDCAPLPVARGEVQRSLPTDVFGIDVCTLIEQHLHDPLVPELSGYHERRVSELVPAVDVGFGHLQQGLDVTDFVVAAGHEEILVDGERGFDRFEPAKESHAAPGSLSTWFAEPTRLG